MTPSRRDKEQGTYKKLDGAKHAQIICGDPAATPVPVDLTPAVQSPTITNLSAPTADTEVSLAIPDGTRKMTVRVRGTANAQFAFVATESGTKYITIPRGSNYSEDGLNTSSLTLYIQTDSASQIIEVLTWS